MPGKIFINYRRGDDAGFTQALYLRLEDEFTAADLFMDVEGHIKPGDDFVEVLNAQVAQADVNAARRSCSSRMAMGASLAATSCLSASISSCSSIGEVEEVATSSA